MSRRFRDIPTLALAILVGVLICGVAADLIAPASPTQGNLRDHFLPPAWVAGGSSAHWLGTDHLGRDLLSRIIHGARVSLVVVVLSVAFAGAFGTLVGLVAGHFGGWRDEVLMRIVDIQLAMPTILIALVVAVLFGTSFELLVFLLAFWLWPTYARLVRGDVLRIRQADYIALAKVAGASQPRILFRHELPAVANTLIVTATLQAGIVILLEGSLSFLGVGVPPPAPSWGSMIAEGRAVIVSSWWVALFPGVAMLLTVLSINLLGDWLRDALDPQRRIAFT